MVKRIDALRAALFGWLYSPISTSTTTLVKTGSGTLHSIVVNAKGTVASSIIAYDALTATGTPIASVDSLNQVGEYVYDVAFSTGLTIVTSGTVAPNVTVTYH